MNLPPGTYTVTFSLSGFAPLNRQGIEVSIGITASLNVTMKVGNVAETVTVSGETPMVDLTVDGADESPPTRRPSKNCRRVDRGSTWPS